MGEEQKGAQSLLDQTDGFLCTPQDMEESAQYRVYQESESELQKKYLKKSGDPQPYFSAFCSYSNYRHLKNI